MWNGNANALKTAETHTSSSNRQTESNKTHFFEPENGQTFFSNAPAQVQAKPFFPGNNPSGVNAKPFLQANAQPASGLTIGKANDQYEQEADRMADRFIQSPPKAHQESPVSTGTTATGPVQAKCAHCEQEEKLQQKEGEAPEEEIRRKPIFESEAEEAPMMGAAATPGVQRKCAACSAEEKLQKSPKEELQEDAPSEVQAKFEFPEVPNLEKEKPPAAPAAEEAPKSEAETPGKDEKKEKGKKDKAKGKAKFDPPEPEPPEPEPEKLPEVQMAAEAAHSGGQVSQQFQSELHSSKGGGQPLPGDVQTEMESHFDSDFSGVRVHTGSQASAMNQSIGAKAFTHGSDIYFNNGQYDMGNSSGKHLLAHELTHTVQQGASGKKVQRFQAEENTVQVDGKADKPNDGSQVENRMDSKIKNDPDFDDDAPRTKAGMSEEDKKKANPERSKVGQEKNEVEAGGGNKPDVDRGAAAVEKTGDQQQELTGKVEEEKEKGKEEKGQEKKEQSAKMAEAALAAAQAVQLQQQAAAIEVPVKPEPFKHPNIEAPEDSQGEPLPRDPDTDMKVRGLGLIGEGLREEGYEMKKKAVQFERVSYSLEAVQQEQRQDLATAEEGTTKMDTHTQERQQISEDSKKALEESKQRQQFTEREAPKIADKADEGGKDSAELKSEAGSKAERAQGEIPDDEDARADAEEQSGEMNSAAEGSASMDDAINQTAAKARTFIGEAEAAKKQNDQTETEIKEGDQMIAKTAAKVQELHAKNAVSDKRLAETAGHPNAIRKDAVKTAASGDQLIQQTYVMEGELNALQDNYLARMKGLKSKEQAEEELKQKNEGNTPEISPARAQLFELAALEGEAFEAAASNLSEEEKNAMLQELALMAQEEEAANKTVDGEEGPPPDPRGQEIAEIDTERKTRATGVQMIADANFNFLDAEKRGQIAAELSVKSMIDDVKSIRIVDMAKGMVEGMVNPVLAIKGAVDGFKKIGAGIGAIFDATAWAKDPLGNLLKIASSITTGLATVFSTVLGIAGMIMALMVAITIASWGFALPFTGPVMGWMGTIMTYAGWGAIISGGLSVYFNYLSYIKNIHDAQSAQTSEALFGEAKEMKQNIQDGMTGAMAVVEGVGAVKMGPVLANKKFLTPNASKMFSEAGGKFTTQVGREFAKEMVLGTAKKIAGLPGAILVGAQKLLSRGKKGLTEFGQKLRALFSRKKAVNSKGNAVPELSPTSRKTQVMETGKLDGQQLTSSQAKTELKEGFVNGKVKKGTGEYSVEVELPNGHTYRRGKNGKWCRFSQKFCFIDNDLDDVLYDSLDELDDETRRMLQQVTKDTDKMLKKMDPNDAAIKQAKVDDPSTGGFDRVKDMDHGDLGTTESICFPAGTLVKTPNGAKPIELVQLGEPVWTFSEHGGNVESKKVTQVHTTHPHHLFRIKLQDGEVISSTGKHPYWVENLQRWLEAKDLLPGMLLKKITGEVVGIAEVTFESWRAVTYNLSIDTNHNYFVGDAGVLVHNTARKKRPNFTSSVTMEIDFYIIEDAMTGKVYVGQAEVSRGGYIQRFQEHIREGIGKPKSWKSKLGTKFKGKPRFSVKQIGRGTFNPVGAAITEKHLAIKHGATGSNGYNRHVIINEKSFQANKHRFMGPCL